MRSTATSVPLTQSLCNDVLLLIIELFKDGVIHSPLRHRFWKAVRWSRFWRISLGPRKCECIKLYGKTVTIAQSFTTFLYREGLPHAHVICYLGLWFDKDLICQSPI